MSGFLTEEIRQSLTSFHQDGGADVLEATHDIRLVSMVEPKRSGLRCHKVVLAAASPLLKQLLLDSPETEQIALDVDFRTLKTVLKFIYDVDRIVANSLTEKKMLRELLRSLQVKRSKLYSSV